MNSIFYDLETEFTLTATKTGKAFEEATKMITLNSANPQQLGIMFLETAGFTNSTTTLDLSNFTAVPNNTTDRVTLSWQYTRNANQTTFFNIYRGSNLIASLNDLNQAVNNYVDLEGIPDTEYMYTLEAFQIVEATNTVITANLIKTALFPAVTSVKGLTGEVVTALGKVVLDWSIPTYTSDNIFLM